MSTPSPTAQDTAPAEDSPLRRALAATRTYGSMIRFSHTVFGLPFAMAATALAHRFAVTHQGADAGLSAWRLLLIVVAFTGARSAAMGFNRIVDRHVDARNPRTASRELPRGAISPRAAWVLTITAAAVFLTAAWALGPLPLLLSPLCLLIIGGYSFFKRFSWSSHLWLGVALALAPGGAWIAVTGSLAGWMIPTLLMIAVATWVAGFDVLYSLADIDFDRKEGLHSIPARFGVVGALLISGALHLGTLAALFTLHILASLGVAHLVGVGFVGVILVYEHVIVRPGDLSRLDQAFFAMNGYVSVGYLAFALVDVLGAAAAATW
jgi:4-hydroxybenzoate polyprenyltransferase